MTTHKNKVISMDDNLTYTLVFIAVILIVRSVICAKKADQ